MNKNYLLFVTLILSIIISANLSIYLDLPYFCQIIPFVLLTFIPGLLMIQILKLNHINSLEKLVLSVGLSFLLVTFSGMITNYLFSSLRPLDISNVLVVLNILLITLLFLGHLINRNPPLDIPYAKFTKIDSQEKLVLIVAILLPALSLMGTFLAKMNNNYLLLYLMISLIAFLVLYITIINKFKEKYYLIAIFSISISLILAYTLISNYIFGSDSHFEFYFFNTIIDSGKWHFNVFTNLNQQVLNSCLTVSILPALYQIILKFPDPTLLFKLFFVLPLSLIPLIVYQISKAYNNKYIYSFLAAIFVISSISFYTQTEAYRTYIAVFFFALAIMVFLSPNLKDIVKKILFTIFMVGIIVSHYSSGYIFIVLLLSSIIILQFIKFIIKKKKLNNTSNNLNMIDFFTYGLLILGFAIMFLWYSQITGSAFDSGVNYLLKTFGQLQNFFLMESRDPISYQAMGSTLTNAPFIRYINFFTSWMSIFFMAIGILTALITVLDLKTLKRKLKLDISIKFNIDFLSLSISSFFIMGAAVILPYILVFYSINRLYYFLIIILSIFFILGGRIVAKILKFKKPHLLILLVLFPILLSNIGITPQFFGQPNSPLLNPSMDLNIRYYIHDSEASSAKWIGNYRNETVMVHTDSGAVSLISIGLIPRQYLNLLGRHDYMGYIFLTYNNIEKGKLYYSQYSDIGKSIDINEFKGIFDRKDRIYDNGNSEILYS